MNNRKMPKEDPLTRALVAIGRKHPQYQTRHITYAAATPDWDPSSPNEGVDKAELIDFDLQRKISIEQDIANDRDLI